MKNELEGKVVAITGASSGIGKATALELARLGVNVVLGARRTEQLKTIVDEIRQEGGNAEFIKLDVRNKEELVQLINKAVDSFGRLDVLINNAGVSQLGRIDELDIDGWNDTIDINLKAVLYGMAAAIPVFKKQQEGHIVNIISTSGIKIVPTQGVYAATKNAVRTLAEAFRQESDGTIRITGISPGFVKTGFADNIKDQQMKATIMKNMDQFAISPQAVANAVIYAISQPKDVEVGDIVIRPAAQN